MKAGLLYAVIGVLLRITMAINPLLFSLPTVLCISKPTPAL